MKGQKLRNALFLRLEVTTGPALSVELLNFVKQEEKVLGTTIHPSMVAAQMTLLPETGRPDEPFYFGFFGRPTVFSERTLKYAVLYLTLYMVVGFVPDERHVDHSRPADQLIGPIQEQVLRGRTALLRLVASLIPYWHHPDLSSDFQ